MFYNNFTYNKSQGAQNKSDDKSIAKIAQDENINGETFIPETVQSDLYVPGFLNTQLGKYMRVEFLVGSTLTDRNGVLEKVGASYILLRSTNGDLVVCDLFSIKFATIVEDAPV